MYLDVKLHKSKGSENWQKRGNYKQHFFFFVETNSLMRRWFPLHPSTTGSSWQSRCFVTRSSPRPAPKPSPSFQTQPSRSVPLSSSSSGASSSTPPPPPPPNTLFGSLMDPLRQLYRRSTIWLLNNAASLLSYQLLLETILTGTVSYALLERYITVDDVENYLAKKQYPLLSWMDLKSGIYTEPYQPLPTAPQMVVDAHTMTAVHSGHNIVMGFLPFQLLFLFATYPTACRVFSFAQPFVDRVPVLKWLFGAQMMPAEVSHWVNRKMGTSIGTTATGGGSSGARTVAASTAAAGGKQQSGAAGAGAQKPNWRQARK